ncbi:deoxyhypusine synthase [Methanosarcinales archaeon]|nr:MAG: deoxyhypusine synthase [Methanosarcinales archaeon]
MSTPIVDPMKIRSKMRVDEIVNEFNHAGVFNAGRIADAVTIFDEMLKSDACKFLGLSGALVPAGLGCMIANMITDGLVDVLVTTGANIVHDVINALGQGHKKGSIHADDTRLREEGISRIYDVYLECEAFMAFERFVHQFFDTLDDGRYPVSRLLWLLGEHVAPGSGSILRAAYESDVPVFMPAFSDSMLGLHAWICTQERDILIDSVADIGKIVALTSDNRSHGALILGGGVPKNFILQSMLISPSGGFDYGIQITMDRPETGGLSGATLDEAKSWAKMREGAKTVTVYSDVTIALPIILAAVYSLQG